jgi:glyoxylate reductase
MSRGCVRVSAPIPEVGLRLLEGAGLEVRLGGLDLCGVDALLCMLTDRIDAGLLERADRLKLVANMAVGMDNVDVAAARRLGIAVSNTPDVLTDATADLAFGLLLAVARRLVWGDRLVRGAGFTGWSPTLGLGMDVTERTLGIIGAGRIGQALAERARGFRMQVLLTRRQDGVPLPELLERSDFVSLHVPLSSETRHLIGEAELRRMRPHAVLVNTARGPIVDENALVRALREGWIAGAGLDVFENEPQLAPGLAELANVVLAPHIGSATIATRNRMAELAATQIIRTLVK